MSVSLSVQGLGYLLVDRCEVLAVTHFGVRPPPLRSKLFLLVANCFSPGRSVQGLQLPESPHDIFPPAPLGSGKGGVENDRGVAPVFPRLDPVFEQAGYDCAISDVDRKDH